MGLCGKIVRKIDVEMNREVIFQIYRKTPNDIAKMCPAIQGVDLLSGHWGKAGSVIVWRYTDQDGRHRTVTEIVEAIDMKNKSVTFKVIDGDLLETFKSFKYIFQGIPEGENNSVAWTLEYEKLAENVKDPEWMMDICEKEIKGVDAYHLRQE